MFWYSFIVYMVYRADTGNHRKLLILHIAAFVPDGRIFSFTYNCLYARPIKVLSV